MKKIVIPILALIITFSLIAFNSSDKSQKGSAKDTAGEKAIKLNKAEFIDKVFDYENNSEEWKFEGDLPCIIDFYADWCQPCKIAGPILEELAAEYEGKIHVYKVDTQKERELASAFGITSIPTFLLCPAEGLPQLFTGIGQSPEETKEIFKQAIDNVLLASKTIE